MPLSCASILRGWQALVHTLFFRYFLFIILPRNSQCFLSHTSTLSLWEAHAWSSLVDSGSIVMGFCMYHMLCFLILFFKFLYVCGSGGDMTVWQRICRRHRTTHWSPFSFYPVGLRASTQASQQVSESSCLPLGVRCEMELFSSFKFLVSIAGGPALVCLLSFLQNFCVGTYHLWDNSIQRQGLGEG